MKTIKYYLIILLSLGSMLLPVAGLAIWYFMQDTQGIILGIILAVTGLFLNKPIRNLRVKYRNEVEYDEFGRSKTKGKYEYLSKKERDQIDLQKTLDMERIVSATMIKKITKKGSETPKKDMDNLIGLGPVKYKMAEMVARMQFDKNNTKKQDAEDSMSGRHMVFYGSPGTGKTTVARILTGFLYQYGYIKENKCIEIDGNFLKAGSDTATKTELVIREAFGGVLFIDEAYALMESGDGSGSEAIATLIKQMEDHRDKFILIMAGYTNEMNALLSQNPGFQSRIKEYLDFPDYNSSEMRQIFMLMAQKAGFVVSLEALDVFDERVKKERELPSFGNARTVRNILSETVDKHALNYINHIIDEDNQFRICPQDIPTQVKRTGFSIC